MAQDFVLLNSALLFLSIFFRLLQNNNISGELPAELGLLSKLQSLDLSNNHFSGGVPDSLGHLASLRYL